MKECRVARNALDYYMRSRGLERDFYRAVETAGVVGESFIEVKRSEQVDQTTQPYLATARQNGIAKNRNDQRACFDAISFTKTV